MGALSLSRFEKEQLKAGFVKDEACWTHIEICGGGPYSVSVIAPKTKVVDF